MDSNIIDEQSEWHGKGKQGCLFASYLSRNPENKAGIIRHVLHGTINDDFIGKINECIREAMLDDSSQMLSIILPSIRTDTDLFRFIGLIQKLSNWEVESEIEEGLILIKMKVHLLDEVDESSNQILSWVLGFGPFNQFAKTRQSPYTEIVLATKSKQVLKQLHQRHNLYQQFEASQERKGHPDGSHLADIFIKGITDDLEKDKRFWKGTSDHKKSILASASDFNAKAKITFSLLDGAPL